MNASVLPRLSRDAAARMRAAIDRKIEYPYIPIISVRNQQFGVPLVRSLVISLHLGMCGVLQNNFLRLVF
jgi:hypothetical protein